MRASAKPGLAAFCHNTALDGGVILCISQADLKEKDAVSIFDRWFSGRSGGDAAKTPAVTPAARRPEEALRFMGREGAQPQAPVAVEKGLDSPALIWLYVQPTTQRLQLVSDLGVAQGEDLNARMTTDLLRAGLCEAVAYHAGYDEYWKMPAQEAILRTPSLFDIQTLPLNRIKLETRLVKQGEPRGFWMHVRMRTAEELRAESAAQ